jgi:predicted acetyltransferase
MIRSAERTDIRELAELWARCFPGEHTAEQRVSNLEMGGVFGGVETAWLAERGGELVGAFRAYALTQHLHDAVYRMQGLAAVAVSETARRRGLGTELCTYAVRMARERGDVLSMLYPFRPAYYTGLGWGLVGELHAHQFRPEALVAAPGSAVRRAGSADWAGIASCYARFASTANGPINRTPRVWRQHLSGEHVHAYVTGAAEVRGYAIIRAGGAATADERAVYLRELVADDEASYDGLLGWLTTQRDSWRVVHYEAAPDELFTHRLHEPRPPGFQNTRNLWTPVARLIRGPMLRVLHVSAALEQRRRWGPATPLQFGLRVEDELLPENAGPFVVEFDGARVAVRRGSARPELHMSAAVFAQIFAGELGLLDAVRLRLVRADGDAGAADTLFRTDRCFRLLDEF